MKVKTWVPQIGVISICASILACSGCAQFKAMDQPKPFKPTATTVGAKRVNVAGELGSPVNSEESNGHLVETYKYVDGGGKNTTGSKVVRVVLYTAGDLFTIFLDQLITWPAESVAFAGTDHVVTIEYEKGDDGFWRIKSFTDEEQSGKKKKAAEPATKTQSPKEKSESPAVKTETAPAKTDPPATNSPPAT